MCKEQRRVMDEQTQPLQDMSMMLGTIREMAVAVAS